MRGMGALPLLLLPGVLSNIAAFSALSAIAVGGFSIRNAAKAAREAKRRQRAALAAEMARWEEKFKAEAELDAEIRAATVRKLPLIATGVAFAGIALALTPSRR